MSVNKYANLPDIDTAPDIYETEDVFPPPQALNATASDEDLTGNRSAFRGGRSTIDVTPGKEELDGSSLIGAEEARRLFKKAERKHDRLRIVYAYPPSPTSSSPPSSPTKPVSLSKRLRTLQAELSALENELSDPSNTQLHRETVDGDVDPGEMIRGLSDVRTRLGKIRHRQEGRGRLVDVVLANEVMKTTDESDKLRSEDDTKQRHESMKAQASTSVVDIDRRIGRLEKLVGSSSAPLDEASPLPPPLLPLLTRLGGQLTLLTQPRHIDSISRRLKLLLSDLDRASNNQQHRRHPSQSNAGEHPTSQAMEQVLPLLSRLGPSLPHIPHILTRLRTLATLHASAAEFQGMLTGLEDEQKKMHQTLADLDAAIKAVEGSMEQNREIVGRNIEGLERRIEELSHGEEEC